jgi:hypothetical protein
MTNETNYFFNGRISIGLDVFRNTKYRKIFNDGYEGVFYSNPIEDYKTCITQCSALVKEIADEIHTSSGKKFEILWESNPKLSKDPNYVSKSTGIQEWVPNEIVRFFIVSIEDLVNQQPKIMAPMVVSVCGIEKDMIKSIESNRIVH